MIGKSIFNKLLLNASLYTASNALLSAAKLVLIPVYTHYLVPEQYGILGTVSTVNIILIMLMSFGIERAVAREYFDYEDDNLSLKSYLITLLIFTVLLNIIIIMIVMVSGFWISGWCLTEFKIPFMPYVPIALAISSATTFYAIFMVILQVRQMASYYVTAQIVRFLITIGVTLSFLIMLRMGAMAVLWAELIGTLITAVLIVMYFIKKRYFPGPLTQMSKPFFCLKESNKTGGLLCNVKVLIELLDYNKLRKALIYSFPLLFFELGGWIISGLDRLFLAKFRSLEDVGIYALGATLAQGLNVLTSSIQTAYLPFFFQTAKSKDGSDIIFARTASIYVLIIGSVCLIGMLFAKEIIGLIAPNAYEKSSMVMRILLLSTFFWSLYRIVVLPLLHLKETDKLAVFIGVSMVVSLAGNLFLIKIFGVAGAAWTNAICYGLLFAMAFKSAAKRYPIKYSAVSFWGVIVLIVLSGLLYDQTMFFRIIISISVVMFAVFLNYYQNHFAAEKMDH